MIDSILRKGNNILNKLDKKNVTAITLVFLLLFVFSLRYNAINLSNQYTSDLESKIRNIPKDQLYNAFQKLKWYPFPYDFLCEYQSPAHALQDHDILSVYRSSTGLTFRNVGPV